MKVSHLKYLAFIMTAILISCGDMHGQKKIDLPESLNRSLGVYMIGGRSTLGIDRIILEKIKGTDTDKPEVSPDGKVHITGRIIFNDKASIIFASGTISTVQLYGEHYFQTLEFSTEQVDRESWIFIGAFQKRVKLVENVGWVKIRGTLSRIKNGKITLRRRVALYEYGEM